MVANEGECIPLISWKMATTMWVEFVARALLLELGLNVCAKMSHNQGL